VSIAHQAVINEELSVEIDEILGAGPRAIVKNVSILPHRKVRIRKAMSERIAGVRAKTYRGKLVIEAFKVFTTSRWNVNVAVCARDLRRVHRCGERDFWQIRRGCVPFWRDLKK
jgi:hypothetical protein